MIYQGFAFDVVLAVVALGIGVFSMVNPEKAWNMLQSKKAKAQIEPTERTYKSTRIMGIALVAIAILFVVFSLLGNLKG